MAINIQIYPNKLTIMRYGRLDTVIVKKMAAGPTAISNDPNNNGRHIKFKFDVKKVTQSFFFSFP